MHDATSNKMGPGSIFFASRHRVVPGIQCAWDLIIGGGEFCLEPVWEPQWQRMGETAAGPTLRGEPSCSAPVALQIEPNLWAVPVGLHNGVMQVWKTASPLPLRIEHRSSDRTRSTLQQAHANNGAHCSKWECSHRLQATTIFHTNLLARPV